MPERPDAVDARGDTVDAPGDTVDAPGDAVDDTSADQPEDMGNPGDTTQTDDGQPTLMFSYTLPAEGAELDQPFLVAVSGPRLARARFAVGATLVAEDIESPFELTLEPARLVLGTTSIQVTGVRDDNVEESQGRLVEIVRDLTPSEILTAIDDLPGGAWFEIPNSQLRSVGWAWPSNDYRGPLAEIMISASGGAWDTTRERLMVFGGGQSYGGNEVYAFDLQTAAWLRLTDPAPADPDNPENIHRATVYPDGTPYARHTYDQLEYLPPPIDRLVCGGATAIWPYGDLGDDRTWYFDPGALEWEEVIEVQPATGYGAVSALGPDGRFWQHGGGSTRLAAFDPETGAWTEHVPFPGWFDPWSTAAIDPVHNLMVAVGGQHTYVWDLAQPDTNPVDLTTTGDVEAQDFQAPGLDYHPGSGVLVLWSGGPAVYTLDLGTAVWTRVEATSDTDPGPATSRGMYGRFRYVPSRDVFILTTSVASNVFVYRLPE